ncbi:MAG: GIY-YIG nuclease family protein [Thermoplasmatota archaeon]
MTEDPSRVNEGADYILLLQFPVEVEVEVGALGNIVLRKGWYAYCGSAKAGLWGRVRRHLSDPSKKRWHIDHITRYSVTRYVFWKEHRDGGECLAASELSRKFDGVEGFGCSDCGCRSHLFELGDRITV